ncbi:MAG: hypothetical protein R2688_04385 [Fimbriimonadaceae bacterium]
MSILFAISFITIYIIGMPLYRKKSHPIFFFLTEFNVDKIANTVEDSELSEELHLMAISGRPFTAIAKLKQATELALRECAYAVGNLMRQ